MRTNIVLDDKLLKKAFKVDIALREFVMNHRHKDPRKLRAKVKIRDDYDYKALRNERN